MMESESNRSNESAVLGVFERNAGFFCSASGVVLMPIAINVSLFFMLTGTVLMIDSLRRLDNTDNNC